MVAPPHVPPTREPDAMDGYAAPMARILNEKTATSERWGWPSLSGWLVGGGGIDLRSPSAILGRLAEIT